MLVILSVILGLAALFGFLLGMYLFTYRVNLPDPLRWLGGAAGGILMAIVMVGATLLIIWPPFSLLILLAGFVFFGIVTAVILGKQPTETVDWLGGEEHVASVDANGIDIDAGARL